MNKKREMELQKLRRDLEEQQLQSEQTSQMLRKKQQDAVNELSEQMDQINKVKSKLVFESIKIKILDILRETRI